jgi:hypothetical protein
MQRGRIQLEPAVVEKLVDPPMHTLARTSLDSQQRLDKSFSLLAAVDGHLRARAPSLFPPALVLMETPCNT